MGKERWVGAAEPVEPISRAFGLVAHPLELATRPPDDIGIDPLQGRAQLRPVEVAVVGDPAADARVVHLGQLSQGFIAAVVQRPAADIAADARQCLRASRGLEAVREDAAIRLHPHYLSGSKLEAEKVKVDVGEVAAPVHILAVDDLCLLRMQHQLAGRKAVGTRPGADMGSVASRPFFCLITGSRPLAFAVVPLMAEDKVMPHSIFALLPARH
jgi:hypothetical protein